MQTIVVNSQKGGSGKSTLCAHLAVEAERAGQGPVFLIDADPQGTLTTWHEKRAAQRPARAEMLADGIAATLEAIKAHDARYVMIDTAPTRDETIETLFAVADLVLVPVRPSPADLWAAGETVAILKEHRHEFLFVLNLVKSNSRIALEAAPVLSHFGPVAAPPITDRVLYASAFTDGRTAPEISRHGREAEDVGKLWTRIHKMLNPGKRKEA